MKSPYRRGVQITVSNAAVQAAATMVAQTYRAGGSGAALRILNLAADIVDEIQAREVEPIVEQKEAA